MAHAIDAGRLAPVGHAVFESWTPTAPPGSRFGDAMIVVFLLAQCLDGVLTYVGVATYGVAIEANPIIAALMLHFGEGTALVGAKIVAAALGILLHRRRVHGAVAALTLFYLTVAIAPWTAILFL